MRKLGTTDLERTRMSASVPRAQGRHVSIDAARGLIMVIMALDHVREFFDADAMMFQAEDLARTTPALFFTRWITHVCAPGFVFLAGVAAYRKLRRDGSVKRLSLYLFTRGLWLVFIELTVMRFALNFRFGAEDPLLLLVLVALGVSMMALAGLVHLPLCWRGLSGGRSHPPTRSSRSGACRSSTTSCTFCSHTSPRRSSCGGSTAPRSRSSRDRSRRWAVRATSFRQTSVIRCGSPRWPGQPSCW